MKLIKINSNKSPKKIIQEIKKQAIKFNFIIREIFDMTEQFTHHGVTVDKNFKYYSIMLCNPEKAYQSIKNNPIRGAILLPPKQIIIYQNLKTKKTVIGYMKLDQAVIKKMLPHDIQFSKSLETSCDKIISLIKAIK